MPPIVLTIAGSDPSGGAGIQADQRVIESLGCSPVSVVTALTSQNTHGVSAVYPVPMDVLRSQLEALLSDVRPDAVKIGMLPTPEHVRMVAETIQSHDLKNVVLDPVLAPTVGEAFLDRDGIELLRRLLLPLCDLVTPNAPESSVFAGIPVDNTEGMKSAGARLVEDGAQAVLIKGGHIESSDEYVTDLLVTSSSYVEFQERRVSTRHTHGTGCFLSSAIACHLALGASLPEAVATAKKQLVNALERPVIVGSGQGYPGRPERLKDAEHMARLNRIRGIYLVTDDRISDAVTVRSIVRQALISGIQIVQLRDKRLPTTQLLRLARQLREDTLAQGALLIINDRIDIALSVDADGVHLGPDDMSPSDARRLLGTERLIGISAGSVEEMETYGDISDVSYFGCGPVFGTRTKRDAGDAIGIDRLVEMREQYPWLPIIAIGGIMLDNIMDVKTTGVTGAAVLSAINRADDPQTAAAELVQLWQL